MHLVKMPIYKSVLRWILKVLYKIAKLQHSANIACMSASNSCCKGLNVIIHFRKLVKVLEET